MKSQITTRRGDSGYATALSGDTYPKSHIVMECVGALDELRAHLALLRLGIDETDHQTAAFLLYLLHTCFVIGSECSDPESKHPEYHVNRITEKDIERIETEQARLEEQTVLPKAFIVSATNELAAKADIACTVARRVERTLVRLRDNLPHFDSPETFIFINRLSDYLYMLARTLDKGRHLTVDYTVLY